MSASTRNPRSPTEIDTLLGQRLRAARKRAKFSQAELASGIGVTYQQIQKYENGVDRVAASRLVQMAAHLGVTAAELLDATDTSYAPLVDGMAAELAAEFTKIESARLRRAALDAVKLLANADRGP